MSCGFAVRRRISKHHNKKGSSAVDEMIGQGEEVYHRHTPTEKPVQYTHDRAQDKTRMKRNIFDDRLSNDDNRDARHHGTPKTGSPLEETIHVDNVRLARDSAPKNDSRLPHRKRTRRDVSSATRRLARFLDRKPHDGGIVLDAGNNIDLERLPEDDHLGEEQPVNETDSAVPEFLEDERIEYSFNRDGRVTGQEESARPAKETVVRDTAKQQEQVRDTANQPVPEPAVRIKHKGVEMRVNINGPFTRDALSGEINDFEINDRNPHARQSNLPTLVGAKLSLENAEKRLSGQGNISDGGPATGYQRIGNNNSETDGLSGNIRGLFSDHPRGMYTSRVLMSRHPTASLFDT